MARDSVLVVLQLSGGNDALNTIIPYGDPLYFDNRPNVRIPEDQVLPINDYIGFHPAMGPIKQLYDEGKVAIIQGIGYPNPSHSHFRSMDIWHTCEPDKIGDEGWLGRTIRDLDPKKENVLTGVNFGRGLPRAMAAPGVPVPSVGNLETYGMLTGIEAEDQRTMALETFSRTYEPMLGKGPVLSYFAQTGLDALKGADILATALEGYSSTVQYGNDDVAQYMKNIVQTHLANLGTRAFYTTAPYNSFDTHAGQLANHARLWTQTSKAIGAFYEDLKEHNATENVLLFVFTEFGRQAHDKGFGTDHGAGGHAFVIGDAVKGGLYGDYPSLEQGRLLEGALYFNNDFRGTYATLLEQWLDLDSKPIVNGSFEQFDILGGGGIAQNQPDSRGKEITRTKRETQETERTEGSMPSRDEESTEPVITEDEGTAIMRYPSIDLAEPIPWAPPVVVELTIDLRMQPDDPHTESEKPVLIEDLTSNWDEQLIHAFISSRDIDFEPGHETGIIVVRRNRDSVPWRVGGIVHTDIDVQKPIEVRATFYRNGRFCGSARRKANIMQTDTDDDGPSPEVETPTSPHSEESPTKDDDRPLLQFEGKSPWLTVEILGPQDIKGDQLHWRTTVRPEDKACIPNDAQHLTPYPKDIDHLFADLEDHIRHAGGRGALETFEAFGEEIYRLMAENFRRTYGNLRSKYPKMPFPIQFVCDDATIPWEFARPPYKEGDTPCSILAIEHPVGRWFIEPPQMTPQIRAGTMVTVTPDYTKRKKYPPAPDNRLLDQRLQQEFKAEPVNARYDDVMELLRNENSKVTRPVSVFVFVGHGSQGDGKLLSIIHLEDRDLPHTSVNRAEVCLGTAYQTLVVFNACQTGGVQKALGKTTGWARAFVNRGFGGFFAPFWSVYERPAANFILDFLSNVRSGTPIGEAAYTVRSKNSDKGLEYLAYVYYGDVMARIG